MGDTAVGAGGRGLRRAGRQRPGVDLADRGQGQQRWRKSSSTRTPNLSASTGTRSSTPWNMPKKSSSAGRRRGANPKQRIPSVLNDLASVPPDRQYGTTLADGSAARRASVMAEHSGPS